MSETIGNREQLRLREPPLPFTLQCLRWIHADKSDSEQRHLLADFRARYRSASPPVLLQASAGDQIVAAAYFHRLPGRVANLGGARAVPNHIPLARRLLQQLTDDLYEEGICQIQGVLEPNDIETASLLADAGFSPLTSVKHLWLDVHSVSAKRPRIPSDSGFQWTAAHQVTREELEAVVESTFDGTLDCPSLNDLRSASDVVESFLDGRTLMQIDTWELLRFKSKIVGCLLLDVHSQGVTELAYMGLERRLRGRKLGRVLVQRAAELSLTYGSKVLAAAVDEQNWPALNLYAEQGFQYHQTFSVWLQSRCVGSGGSFEGDG